MGYQQVVFTSSINLWIEIKRLNRLGLRVVLTGELSVILEKNLT